MYRAAQTTTLLGGQGGGGGEGAERKTHHFNCPKTFVPHCRYIYMTKAVKSVSKQGQLQPRCHPKARPVSRQL